MTQIATKSTMPTVAAPVPSAGIAQRRASGAEPIQNAAIAKSIRCPEMNVAFTPAAAPSGWSLAKKVNSYGFNPIAEVDANGVLVCSYAVSVNNNTGGFSIATYSMSSPKGLSCTVDSFKKGFTCSP